MKTIVKFFPNPKYPLSCLFAEVAEIPKEVNDDVYGTMVDIGEKIIVINSGNEPLFMKPTRECEDPEKERIGVKPGLVSIGADDVITEIFPKAWQCTRCELSHEDAAKAMEAMNAKDELMAIEED